MLRVDLAPEEVLAMLRDRADVERPGAPQRRGSTPAFEALKLAPDEIRLRARLTPLDEASSAAVSPTIVVTLSARPWGTQVRGHFVTAANLAESAQELTRCTLLLLVVGGLLATGGAVAWASLAAPASCLYAAASLASLRVTWRVLARPWRSGMRTYGPALRGLVGELLTPHALPAQIGPRHPFRAALRRRPAKCAHQESNLGLLA